MYIQRVDNWQSDFLSHQHLDWKEWSLHLVVFQDLCGRLGMVDVDLMDSGFYQTYSNPLMEILVLWDQLILTYAFPPLKLSRIAQDGIPAILIVPVWPRWILCANLLRLLGDVWVLLHHQDRLSQRLLCNPSSVTGLTYIAVEAQVLRDRGITESVIPTIIKSTSRKDVEGILHLVCVSWLPPFEFLIGMNPLLLQKGLDQHLALSTIKSQVFTHFVLFKRPLVSLTVCTGVSRVASRCLFPYH